MKSKIYIFSINFFALFILFNAKLKAQCNPALVIEPAGDCFTALDGALGNGSGFICWLDDFCMSTHSAPHLANPIPFCNSNSQLDNPVWFSFVADSSGVLDLAVTSQNCIGEGTQWAIFDECGSNFNTIACQSAPAIPPNSQFFITAPVIPGNVYALVIDGFNGGACDFHFDSFNDNYSVVGEVIDSTLTGDTTVCKNQSINYSFGGYNYATQYIWTFYDSEITTSSPMVTFNFYNKSPGIYPLCVKAVNECDDIGKILCWDIEILVGENVDDTLYTCPGDSVLFEDIFYSAGVYDSLPYFDISSCISSVNLTVLEKEVPDDTLFEVVICSDQGYLDYQGQSYYPDSTYEEVSFETLEGCQYSTGLNVFKIDDEDLKIVSDKAALPCVFFDIATLTLVGNTGSHNEILDEKYKWTNENGNLMGEERSVQVVKHGTYFLEVTTKVSNPDALIGFGNEIICTKHLNFTVANKDSTMEAPGFFFDVLSADNNTYSLTLTNFPDYLPGTQFIWTVPEGIHYEIINAGYLFFTLPDAGVYEICVQAINPCGVQTQGCYSIIIDDLSKSSIKPNDINLIMNPVNEILSFDLSGLSDEEFHLNLTDIRGNILYDKPILNPNTLLEINVAEFIPGIYLYEFIKKDGARHTGKFIKQ